MAAIAELAPIPSSVAPGANELTLPVLQAPIRHRPTMPGLGAGQAEQRLGYFGANGLRVNQLKSGTDVRKAITRSASFLDRAGLAANALRLRARLVRTPRRLVR